MANPSGGFLLRSFRPLFILLIFFALLAPRPAWAAESFPTPKGLEPAVKFWIAIFTKYSEHQVLLHDAEHLDLVYEVIQLEGGGPPAKVNPREREATVFRAKERYRELLGAWAKKSPDPAFLPDPIRRLHHELTRPGRRYSPLEARENLRSQSGLRERFLAGLVRSGLYLDRMKETFRQQGLPEDLVALAHVESSFQTHALSRSGAAGIWQFTRDTGKRFLTINSFIDERRDPFLSTVAAARLLKENYAELGSWPLAVTAYNHGLSGMKGAVRTVGTTDFPTIVRRYRGRAFGFASRNFYAEFLAAREVARHPERYFGRVELSPPLRYEVFRVPEAMGIGGLSQRLGVGREEIRELNPALRPPILEGRRFIPKGYALRVPAGKAREMARAYVSPPSGERAEEKGRSQEHEVQRGDTLSRIARLFGISVPSLMAANNLRDPNLIREGAILAIPGREAGKPSRLEKDKPNGGRGEPPEREKTEPPRAALPGKTAKEGPAVSAERKPKASPTKESPLPVVISPVEFPKASREQGWTRVEPEETLGHFAGWLGVEPEDLRRLNGLKPGEALRMGQRISLTFHRVSAEEFGTKRLQHHKGLVENFFEVYQLKGTRTHVLRPGENLWDLSRRRYGVPFWLVARYNPDKILSRLSAGERVVFPVVRARAAEPLQGEAGEEP